MSAIDPTCLPWQTKHDFDVEGRTTIIGNVDGEIIDGSTHHSYDFVARTLDEDDDSQSRSIAVANADFIVLACNNHKALFDALVAAKQELWLQARHQWTMRDFKNFAVVQQIDRALQNVDGKRRTEGGAA